MKLVMILILFLNSLCMSAAKPLKGSILIFLVD